MSEDNVYGPATHDYNPATGMTREQYRDAWMGSGINTIQGQQDWLARNGGQMVSGSGQTVTPYGDVLDMQIGARTGNGRPGWTNNGGGMAAPSSNFNIQQDFSQQQQQQNNQQAPSYPYTTQPVQIPQLTMQQMQDQMKGPAYAGSVLAASQLNDHSGNKNGSITGYNFNTANTTSPTGPVNPMQSYAGPMNPGGYTDIPMVNPTQKTEYDPNGIGSGSINNSNIRRF